MNVRSSLTLILITRIRGQGVPDMRVATTLFSRSGHQNPTSLSLLLSHSKMCFLASQIIARLPSSLFPLSCNIIICYDGDSFLISSGHLSTQTTLSQDQIGYTMYKWRTRHGIHAQNKKIQQYFQFFHISSDFLAGVCRLQFMSLTFGNRLLHQLWFHHRWSLVAVGGHFLSAWGAASKREEFRWIAVTLREKNSTIFPVAFRRFSLWSSDISWHTFRVQITDGMRFVIGFLFLPLFDVKC